MYQARHILVPTDFSEHSAYAFAVARDLARQNGGEVLILHVAAPPGPEQVSFGEVATEVVPDSYFQRLLQELHQMFPASGKDVPVQYLITQGEPVEEIDRVARERGCDLIVVGTYGHNVLQRLMGSTAAALVRTAPCPVLTVKLPTPAEAGAPREQTGFQALTK
jgi:universal stress protein A